MQKAVHCGWLTGGNGCLVKQKILCTAKKVILLLQRGNYKMRILAQKEVRHESSGNRRKRSVRT